MHPSSFIVTASINTLFANFKRVFFNYILASGVVYVLSGFMLCVRLLACLKTINLEGFINGL
jgi:hypothetical protein